MRKMKIGLQMAWMNGQGHANWIGDHEIAESWAKWLRRREDVGSVRVFPGGQLQPTDYDVIVNFHPGLPVELGCKFVMYHQNAWDESFYRGGTIGVFRAIKHQYHGHLFPSEKLRGMCGGVGTTIPFAADPEVFTYQPDEKYNLPVTFCGNDIRGAELNERYLIPAIPHGLKVWGGPYVDPRIQAVHRGRLPEGELPKLYSSSRCNLNIHIKGHAEMEVVNSRIYECLACGGTICSDYHGGMVEFSEFLYFMDGAFPVDRALQWILDRAPTTDIQTIRRNAILAAHTWEHRMSDLMEYLWEVV